MGGRKGMGWVVRNWWAAIGGLYHPLGLFGLAMGLRSASHRLNMPATGPNILGQPKRHLSTTGVNFRPMPSM